MDGNCHLHIDANCECERHSPGKNIFPHAYEDKWVMYKKKTYHSDSCLLGKRDK